MEKKVKCFFEQFDRTYVGTISLFQKMNKYNVRERVSSCKVGEEIKCFFEKFMKLDTSIGSTLPNSSTSDGVKKQDRNEENGVVSVHGVEDSVLCRSRTFSLAPVRTQHRLIVRNLSLAVSWQDLKDYMRNGGRVTFGQAHKPNRNIGIVEFATYSDMEAAFRQLNHTVLKGKRICLEKARNNSIRKRKHISSCVSSLPFRRQGFSKLPIPSYGAIPGKLKSDPQREDAEPQIGRSAAKEIPDHPSAWSTKYILDRAYQVLTECGRKVDEPEDGHMMWDPLRELRLGPYSQFGPYSRRKI